MSTPAMDVPESQRLIAVSLGKIAASRGQKGGINLHKNLLVATVLHKARTAYMIQHINAAKQRAAATPTTTPATTSTTTTTTTTTPPPQQPQQQQQAVDMDQTQSEQATSSTPSSPSAAAPTFHTPSPASPAAPHKASVADTASAESGSARDGAEGSSMQVAECEDKENTPPPSSPVPADCEKRLQQQPQVQTGVMDCGKDSAKELKPASSLSPRSAMSHAQQSTRAYVSGSTSCSSCVLKRRRATDRDNDNVSAPKVRILESRVSSTDSSTAVSSPEPMQCDSPQISSLVNIFSTSFSGLSGASAPGSDMSARSVGQSILSSVASHKLSENLTCAKEMKFGLDSVHQPIVLSV